VRTKTTAPRNKRRIVEETEGEDYLHKYVWRAALRQLEQAKKKLPGSIYEDMVAMTLAFHALEGYLNFLGDKIAPELWEKEREVFRSGGIMGKLTELHQRCRLPVLSKGRQPYSTIKSLEKLRNCIAHPKTIKTRSIKEFDEDKERPLFPPSMLEGLVSHTRAIQSLERVKFIADSLHKAAGDLFPDAGLGSSALEGSMAINTSSAWLKE
jgi:hypothetical protein